MRMLHVLTWWEERTATTVPAIPGSLEMDSPGVLVSLFLYCQNVHLAWLLCNISTASGNDGGMESSIEGGGISGGVVAAVVVVLLLVVGALAVAAGLVGFVLYRRKKLSQQQLTSHTGNNIGMLIRYE